MQNEKFIPQRGMNRCKNSGVTLTELIVVIAIVGILVVALGFSFQGWTGKYKVEAATKQIYSDLMDARARAMQFNRDYFVDFPSATTYRMTEDTNDNFAFEPGAGDTVIPTFPKTVEYTLNWISVPNITLANVVIVFDKRGLISIYDRTVAPITLQTPNPGTISLTSTADPDYDCIVIASTRINIGKWNTATTSCDAK
jgi:prepilin-type N-terminal cleavage/methylation domain-containing protein